MSLNEYPVEVDLRTQLWVLVYLVQELLVVLFLREIV